MMRGVPKPVFRDLPLLIIAAVGLVAVGAIGFALISGKIVEPWLVTTLKALVSALFARTLWLWRGLFKA